MSTPRKRSGGRILRRAVVVTVALPVLFVGVNIALIWDSSPTSHWKSEADKQSFERVYAEVMALLPPPTVTRDVPTDFGSVRAYRFEKPGADEAYRSLAPLVLLPGHSAPTPMWLGNIPRLMEQRPVIAIDLLAQPGMSVPTRKIGTHADQARWLDQTLAGMGVEKAHLLGVSFGGWTAMNLVRHHPERVASVGLLDPAFVFAGPTTAMLAATMLTLFPLMPPAYTEWFTSWTAGGAPADETVPEARVVNAGIDAFVVVQPSPDVISDDDLRAVRVPVWAVMAGRSVVHDSQAGLRRGQALVAAIDISLRPEASHAIHGEYGDEMDAKALAFAAQHEPR